MMRGETLEEGKKLSERYRELDKTSAENIVAFLYTASEENYDLKDPKDVYELYRFATLYGGTDRAIREEVKLLLGDKKPRILHLAKNATSTAEDYDSIIKFVYFTEQEPDNEFINFYNVVMRILELKLYDQYVCNLKSYAVEEKKRKKKADAQKIIVKNKGLVVHHVYLTRLQQLNEYLLRIIRILLDVKELDNPMVTIEFSKPVKKGEEPQNEVVHLYREGNLYRVE